MSLRHTQQSKTQLYQKQQKNCSQVALYDRGGTSQSKFNISIFVKESWFSYYNTDKSGFSTVLSCLSGQKICLQKETAPQRYKCTKRSPLNRRPSACWEIFWTNLMCDECTSTLWRDCLERNIKNKRDKPRRAVRQENRPPERKKEKKIIKKQKKEKVNA